MKNLIRDAYLFLFVLIMCGLGRVSILYIFPNADAKITLSWLWLCLRFDLMTAAYIVFPTAIATILALCLNKDFPFFKKIYANVAICISTLIAVLNTCFFYEYDSQFNYWIWGAFSDDITAIIETVRQDYPVLIIFVVMLAYVLVVSKITSVIFKKTERFNEKKPIKNGIVISVLYILILLILMRGCKLHGRPLQLRDTAITSSTYLNNIVPSSAYCIKTELVKYLKSSGVDALDEFGFKEKHIPSIANEIFCSNEKNIDKILTKQACGILSSERPSRIFLIIGEGNPAWPLNIRLPNYNLMPMQTELCKNALFSKVALPSGRGTMLTVSSLISGLPATELSVKGVAMQTKDYAFAKHMNALGYSSTFWYAGQSTWLQLGDFARFNGFDEVVGGESMGDIYGSAEWGMRDKDMFNFISNTDIAENSFNVILTVSNHPPYDVNLPAEGCPAKLTTELDKKIWHIWYADKCIGAFVKKIMEKYPDSLIIITGDHSSREVPEEIESNPIVRAVPIIFLGKCVENLKNEVGVITHMDIMPTLIDIIAPKGFEYKSWGYSVFDKSRKIPPMNTNAVGIDGKIVPIDSTDCSEKYKRMQRIYMALSYYRSISDGDFSDIKEK